VASAVDVFSIIQGKPELNSLTSLIKTNKKYQKTFRSLRCLMGSLWDREKLVTESNRW